MGPCRLGQGRAGQGRAGTVQENGRAGQDRTRQGRAQTEIFIKFISENSRSVN